MSTPEYIRRDPERWQRIYSEVDRLQKSSPHMDHAEALVEVLMDEWKGNHPLEPLESEDII